MAYKMNLPREQAYAPIGPSMDRLYLIHANVARKLLEAKTPQERRRLLQIQKSLPQIPKEIFTPAGDTLTIPDGGCSWGRARARGGPFDCLREVLAQNALAEQQEIISHPEKSAYGFRAHVKNMRTGQYETVRAVHRATAEDIAEADRTIAKVREEETNFYKGIPQQVEKPVVKSKKTSRLILVDPTKEG